MLRLLRFMRHMMNLEHLMSRLFYVPHLIMYLRLFLRTLVHWHILQNSAHIFCSAKVCLYCLIGLRVPVNRCVESFAFLQNFLSSIDLVLDLVHLVWINRLEHFDYSVVLDFTLFLVPMISYYVVDGVEDARVHFLMKDCCIYLDVCLCSCVYDICLQLGCMDIVTFVSFFVDVMGYIELVLLLLFDDSPNFRTITPTLPIFFCMLNSLSKHVHSLTVSSQVESGNVLASRGDNIGVVAISATDRKIPSIHN